jgi:hypothetical protein
MRVDPKEQLKTTEAIANELTRGPRSSAFRYQNQGFRCSASALGHFSAFADRWRIGESAPRAVIRVKGI